jgi:membrane protein implicated in regulation of membrane protease activity
MLTLYWLCFAVGGVFVLLAVLSGFDGVDFGDQDVDIQWDDVEWSTAKERSLRVGWYNLFSILKTLKFWTFALCFFGLTGLVLSHLPVGLPANLVAIAAVSMGIVCGSLVAGSLQFLGQRQVDSLVRAPDLVGLTGIVEVPFDRTRRGKVRLLIKGSMIDLLASTDEAQTLQQGDRVLVVSAEQNRLWVVAAQEDFET